MRLAGQVQLGYYPTPQPIMERLVQGFRPPAPTASHPKPSWTAFDPFCGTGEALSAFHAPFSAGTEIDQGRLAIASTCLTTTLEADAMALKPRSHRVSVLLLNPPYDDDPLTHTRVETQALTTFLPWVHPRGWILYIIPRRTLQSSLRLCDTDLWVHHLWRFPDPEYSTFEQVILIAQPRQPHDPPNAWEQLIRLDHPNAPDETDTTDLYNYFHQSSTSRGYYSRGWLTPLPPTLPPRWSLPSTSPFTLETMAPSESQLLAALQQSDPWSVLRGQTLPRPTLRPDHALRTPLTLHRGHMATLLTAGLLTGAIGQDHQRHLVKGRIVPYTVVTERTDTKEVQESRFAVELHTLHPDGTLQSWHHDLTQDSLTDGSDLADEANDAS